MKNAKVDWVYIETPCSHSSKGETLIEECKRAVAQGQTVTEAISQMKNWVRQGCPASHTGDPCEKRPPEEVEMPPPTKYAKVVGKVIQF